MSSTHTALNTLIRLNMALERFLRYPLYACALKPVIFLVTPAEEQWLQTAALRRTDPESVRFVRAD